MKLLLDTHTFIWLLFEPDQLSPHVVQLCQEPANDIVVSVVSLWEIVIKQQGGKLALRRAVKDIIENPIVGSEIVFLPVLPHHVLSLEPLPLHHRDPFDRLLIAQAIAEQAVLLTRDSEFGAYPVQTIW